MPHSAQPSSPLTRLSSLTWPARHLPWPGLCLICQRAQWQAVCRHCIAAFAAPRPRCTRCALALKERSSGQVRCKLCEDHPPEFDQAFAAVDYTSPWRELIARFKFGGEVALARPLSRLMAAPLRSQTRRSRPQWILPTPLSAARLRERGYNQSWHLARGLSRELGIPALPHALERVKDTSRLMSMEADDRRHHIKGAFRIASDCRRALAGRRVAVVDDVLTTGATLNEITRTLMEGGVREVAVWVVARTPGRGELAQLDQEC